MPSSIPLYSSAASDVYKRQPSGLATSSDIEGYMAQLGLVRGGDGIRVFESVSYTHLRAHETRHDLVCRLLYLSIRRQRQMCIRDSHRAWRRAATSRATWPSLASCVAATAFACSSLSLIHISEPTRLGMISYAVFYTSLFVGSVRCV